MRIVVPTIVLASLMAVGSVLAGPAPVQVSPTPAGAELQLPITMDKVWIRARKKKGMAKLRAYNHSGDLTITDDGIEFVAKKNSYFFPMHSLTMISYGKFGSNVDTRWAVVGIREGETTRLMGFRDGRKLGYGNDTEAIFHNLRLAAKKHGAAQFHAPEGFKPYASIDSQLILVIPEEWNIYILTSVFVGDRAPWGKTVFSPAEVEELEYREDDVELRQMYQGEHAAILLDRTEAGSGMNCDGLSRKAREKLLERASGDRIYGRNPETISAFTVSDETIVGCNGIRIEGETRGSDGIERVIDLRAFAHDGTLFLLGVRSHADEYSARREVLQSVVDGMRLPVAIRIPPRGEN
jgi:hypothetical protein